MVMNDLKKENNISPATPACCYTIIRQANGKVEAFYAGQLIKHVVLHSPAGFNFGYLGSGPADLALSILCDFFERHHIGPVQQVKNSVLRFHQDFKRKFLAYQKNNSFTIGEDEIIVFLGDYVESSALIADFINC